MRCPLNKLRTPPSKETCSAPVFVATGSCLLGPSLKFSLVTIKFLVKDYTWKELERPKEACACLNYPVSIIKLLTHIVIGSADLDLPYLEDIAVFQLAALLLSFVPWKAEKQRLHIPNEEVRTEQRLYSVDVMSSSFNPSYCGLCNPLCLKRSLGFCQRNHSQPQQRVCPPRYQ